MEWIEEDCSEEDESESVVNLDEVWLSHITIRQHYLEMVHSIESNDADMCLVVIKTT